MTSPSLFEACTHAAFQTSFHLIAPDAARSLLASWVSAPDFRQRTVLTSNVGHVCLAQRQRRLDELFSSMTLRVVDGAPLAAYLGLITGRRVHRVTGSDLVPSFLAGADAARVFVLGGTAGVAREAARRLVAAFPQHTVVGTWTPPQAFDPDDEDVVAQASAAVEAAAPDLLLIGITPPKQELLARKLACRSRFKVAICCGATLDLMAGRVTRAPLVLRRIGLEWLYRLVREPARLAPRYLGDAVTFPRAVWRDLEARWWKRAR